MLLSKTWNHITAVAIEDIPPRLDGDAHIVDIAVLNDQVSL
jgi:hypothetical protein